MPGTSPPKSSTESLRHRNDEAPRLADRKKPVEPDDRLLDLAGSACSQIDSGVRIPGEQDVGVTLLTDTSVAWADKMVATNSWNAF